MPAYIINIEILEIVLVVFFGNHRLFATYLEFLQFCH